MYRGHSINQAAAAITAPFVPGAAYQKYAEDIFRQTASSSVKKHGEFFDAIHSQFVTLFHARRYFEYIDYWVGVLDFLKSIDSQLFDKIHKGTPYYFCGVASFMAQDYQRSAFYFYAALIEDK